MKTLHVSFGFAPDPTGGTEVYVESLCRELGLLGIDSVVAAPGPITCQYAIRGISVRRFAIDQRNMDVASLYGDGDLQAAAKFDQILDDERPDLVHQHALTSACSLQLARRVKRRGLPLVFTYHTPTTSCPRGTLMEWGRAVCDGRLDARRCAACTIQGRGASRGMSRFLAATPEAVGETLAWTGLHGGPWTALRMRNLVAQRRRALRAFFDLADRVVALAPWVRDVLAINGVDAEKIVDCRHGIPERAIAARRHEALREGPLRIVHLGRLDPVKGTELLIRALRCSPAARVELDIYGIVQEDAGSLLVDKLTRLSRPDPRIHFLPPIPQEDVVDRLTRYDVVAVPSQWMETGPLVVLEAFAAGTPVVGSALGGIADKVQDGISGLLVNPPDSVRAWSSALTRLGDDRGLVERLAQRVPPVRAASDVAREMSALYNELLADQRPRRLARPALDEMSCQSG